MDDLELLEVQRQHLFRPLKTPEDLHAWVLLEMNIELPRSTIHHTSNSNPLDLIWNIYNVAVNDEAYDPKKFKFLGYAARGAGKTLSAAVLEVLLIFHGNRDVCHLAALERQSEVALGYVRDFVYLPVFRDFVTEDNKRNIGFTKYVNRRTKEVLSPIQYAEIAPTEQLAYEKITRSVVVVVATKQSCNGIHASFGVLDEVDLIEEKAYVQFKGVPVKTKDKKVAITFLTSTRKFPFGLVQQEIDKAAKSGIIIKHWNAVDVCSGCPPERHRPDLPRLPIYVDESELVAKSEEEFNALNEVEKIKYEKTEGFHGCIKGECKLFPVCYGRLATEQKSSPDAVAIKEIDSFQNELGDTDLDTIKTEWLCLKPAMEGLVYPRLNEAQHKLTAAQIYTKITQKPCKSNLSKKELVDFLKKHPEVSFIGGMDHGYTVEHPWTTAIGAKFGHYCFVIEGLAAPKLEIGQRITVANKVFRHYDATFWADTANPADNDTYKLHNYNFRTWKKTPGSVLVGIGCVKLKLNPSLGAEPELYFLRDDPGVDMIFDHMSKYHWKVDSNEKSLDVPDDELDDACFTADTEILTEMGWISLASVSTQDKICAIDKSGNALFEHPSRTIHKKYTGPMITVHEHHLKFSATKDHVHGVMTQYNAKVVKKWELGRYTYDELCSESYWANGFTELPGGAGLFKEGPNEAWMAGFWVAEGCFDSGRPSFLLFDQKKETQKAEFRNRASSLGWTWSETQIKSNLGMIRFVISRQRERADQWRNWFGSGAKFKKLQPTLVQRMTKEERKQFFEGYMAGDGCRPKLGGWHFDSVSFELISGLQFLCLSLGYGCRIVTYDCMKEGQPITAKNDKGKQYFSSSRMWRAHIIRKRAITHVLKENFHVWEAKDIDVHCVTTSTGYFLARTAGDVFVAHNCDAIRYMIMNAFPIKAGERSLEGFPSTGLPDQKELEEMTVQEIQNKLAWEAIASKAGVDFSQARIDESEPKNNKKKGIKFSF